MPGRPHSAPASGSRRAEVVQRRRLLAAPLHVPIGRAARPGATVPRPRSRLLRCQAASVPGAARPPDSGCTPAPTRRSSLRFTSRLRNRSSMPCRRSRSCAIVTRPPAGASPSRWALLRRGVCRPCGVGPLGDHDDLLLVFAAVLLEALDPLQVGAAEALRRRPGTRDVEPTLGADLLEGGVVGVEHAGHLEDVPGVVDQQHGEHVGGFSKRDGAEQCGAGEVRRHGGRLRQVEIVVAHPQRDGQGTAAGPDLSTRKMATKARSSSPSPALSASGMCGRSPDTTWPSVM